MNNKALYFWLHTTTSNNRKCTWFFEFNDILLAHDNTRLKNIFKLLELITGKKWKISEYSSNIEEIIYKPEKIKRDGIKEFGYWNIQDVQLDLAEYEGNPQYMDYSLSDNNISQEIRNKIIELIPNDMKMTRYSCYTD